MVPTTTPEPPRLARWILRRVTLPRERDLVDGELRELWRERVASLGRGGARRWYRRQVAGYALRLLQVRAGDDWRGGGLMQTREWIRDLKGAVRALRRRPGFAAVVVATLALGIGANSAIFTLVNAQFLAPLPYQEPGELVLLWETPRDSREVTTVAPGNLFAWKERARSFETLAGYNVDFASVSGDDAPAEQVAAAVVEPGFFELLGAAPALGSGFSADAARAADGELVMLSHSLWTRRYGADPAMVGRTVRVDGRPHTVVGVMPPRFRQPERSLSWQGPELWRPMLLEAQRDDFDSRYLRVVARLRDGVDPAAARTEMEALAAELATEHPEANGGRAFLVRELDEYLTGDARPVLILLLVAGAAVLLVTCANVANLILARGQERRREFAVRAALGSGRARLLRQVTVEAVVLALAGAAAGALVVLVGRDLLQAVQTRFFSNLVDVAMDARVVLATLALGVVAGLASGLPLAASVGGGDLRGALGAGRGRAGEQGSGVTRNLLIVGQVGLATALLVVALLLTRSFGALVDVPPGFRSGGLVTLSVWLPTEDYPGRPEVESYFRELHRVVEEVPGVERATLVSDLPFTTENRWQELVTDAPGADPDNPLRAEYHTVLPDYFEVMGIPVLQGEVFDDGWAPREGEIPVAVSRSMAEAFWPDADPVGEGFGPPSDPEVRFRVVAVVGDVLDDGFDAQADATFYWPYGAQPQRGMALVVRVAGPPADFLDPLRRAVASLDPSIPVANLRPMDELMAETVARPRAASLIGGAFALLAVLVAAAGIYGVLSYAVQRRTREIGVRAALGASGGELLRMVVGHSSRLLVMGLLLGLLGALVAGRALAGLLFGVRAWDPVSFLAAAALLGLVGTAAAWLPARRAVRVDPRVALRAE